VVIIRPRCAPHMVFWGIGEWNSVHLAQASTPHVLYAGTPPTSPSHRTHSTQSDPAAPKFYLMVAAFSLSLPRSFQSQRPRVRSTPKFQNGRGGRETAVFQIRHHAHSVSRLEKAMTQIRSLKAMPDCFLGGINDCQPLDEQLTPLLSLIVWCRLAHSWRTSNPGKMAVPTFLRTSEMGRSSRPS